MKTALYENEIYYVDKDSYVFILANWEKSIREVELFCSHFI